MTCSVSVWMGLARLAAIHRRKEGSRFQHVDGLGNLRLDKLLPDISPGWRALAHLFAYYRVTVLILICQGFASSNSMSGTKAWKLHETFLSQNSSSCCLSKEALRC